MKERKKLFRISLFGYNKKDVNEFIMKLDRAKAEKEKEEDKTEKKEKEAQ